MKRARLILVAPAVAGLVFAGVGPAAADTKGRTDADIVRIDNNAYANRDGDRVTVRARYECEGRSRNITTHVTLSQGRAYFEAKFRGHLDCDGDEHTQTVRLYPTNRHDLENRRATVHWEYKTDRRALDDKDKRVRVSGVDDDNRR